MKIKSIFVIAVTGLLLSGFTAFKLITSNWKVNAKDAKITFTMMGGKHTGTMSDLDATIDFDMEHPELAAIKATVSVKSVETGMGKLNDHLQTPDFFDAANHPTISFIAEQITKNDSGFVAIGKLAMRDSVHTVNIPFTFVQKENAAVIKGTISLNAGDYGVGQKSDVGKDHVDVFIEVPLTKE